jgi:hypothetical protein
MPGIALERAGVLPVMENTPVLLASAGFGFSAPALVSATVYLQVFWQSQQPC